MIEKTTVREIAENERGFYVTEPREWPDCATVSQDIIDTLEKHHSDTYTSIHGIEFQINGEYYHYAVEIRDTVNNESMIVDASFSQFAMESDTPISLAPISDINPITITSPAEAYIFYENKTNELTELNRI